MRYQAQYTPNYYQKIQNILYIQGNEELCQGCINVFLETYEIENLKSQIINRI
jgi:hypothetical protein